MNDIMISQGWECPKCGHVMSPSAQFCYWCPQQTVTTDSSGGIIPGDVSTYPTGPWPPGTVERLKSEIKKINERPS